MYIFLSIYIIIRIEYEKKEEDLYKLQIFLERYRKNLDLDS